MNREYLQHEVDSSPISMLDKTVLVTLRDDDRVFLGILRSFDQFHNLVLEKAVEMVVYKNLFFEKKIGVQVIRGESVRLLCELNLAATKRTGLKQVTESELNKAKEEDEAKEGPKKTIVTRQAYDD